MPLVPVLQGARLREQGGLPGGPLGSRATQVDAFRRGGIEGGGIGEEPGLAIAQAEEGHRAGAIVEHRGIEGQACAAVIGEGAAVGIQDDDLRLPPQGEQRGGIATQVVGAIERAIDEGKGRRAVAHTVNDEPQPQVVFAFGLRITYCAPVSDSV